MSGTEGGDRLVAATDAAWSARLPLVVLVCGLPASGKTRLMVAISGAAGLPRIAADVVRKELAGIEPAHLAAPEHYTEAFHRTLYAELGRRAAVHVGRAGGAVVDGSFSLRAMRDAFVCAFDGAAPLLFAECTAPPEVLARRADERSRRSRISDATLELVLQARAKWEAFDELPLDAYVRVRTDRPSKDIIADLAAILDARQR
jgi:uncharacterized protein